MQTVVQVICTSGPSLRELIAKDRSLSEYSFELMAEKKSGRSPGWAKVRSLALGRQGSINIEWHSTIHILVCRVVNRGSGKPTLIVGDFVHYLLKRYASRVRLISVVPQSR